LGSLQLRVKRFRARQLRTTWRGAVKKLVMTTLLLAVVVLAAAAAPAAAQMPGQSQTGPAMNLFDEGRHLKTDEEVKGEQERERAYKSGISKIPDQKVKVDPWGAVRTTPPTAANQRPPAK
jgi:hypothetical protein